MQTRNFVARINCSSRNWIRHHDLNFFNHLQNNNFLNRLHDWIRCCNHNRLNNRRWYWIRHHDLNFFNHLCCNFRKRQFVICNFHLWCKHVNDQIRCRLKNRINQCTRTRLRIHFRINFQNYLRVRFQNYLRVHFQSYLRVCHL